MIRVVTLTAMWAFGTFLVMGSPVSAAENQNVVSRMTVLLETNNIGSRAVFTVPVSVIETWHREQTQKKTTQEDDAPTEVLLANWQAFVSGSPAAPDIRIEMMGMAFKASPAKPVRVPLAPVGTGFKSVLLNNTLTPPREDGKWYFLNVTNTGPFAISIGLSSTPVEQGFRKELRLIKRGFAVSTVTVSFKEALEVTVPGQPGRLVGTVSGGTAGCIALSCGDPFSLVYGPVEARVSRAATPSLSPSMAWIVGEKMLSARALLEVTLLSGSAEQLTLLLPERADNIKLTGSDIKEAQASAGQVTAFFKGPLTGRTVLRLSFDMPRAAGNLLKLPELGIQGGRVDNSGWIAIVKDTGGELLEESNNGAEGVSAAELPEDVKGLLSGTPLYAYRRTAQRATVVLDHVATTPFPLVDTIADRAEMTCVLRPSGEELWRISYTMRNNRKQFLRVRLPENAQLLTVSVDGKLQQPSRDGTDLLLPLVKSIQTLEGLVSFPVELVYARRRSEDDASPTAKLALPVLQNAPVAVVNLTLLIDKEMAIQDIRGTLSRVTTFSTANGEGITYGYRTTATPAPLLTRWKEALAKNYFQVGYQAYRSDQLEEAEAYLAKAQTETGLSPDYSIQTESLRKNIRVARGEIGKDTSRETRAKVSQIQRQLSQGNDFLEAQQAELIQGGVQQLSAGNDELAIAALQEADVVNSKIGQRGGSVRDRKRTTEQLNSKLKEAVQRKEEKNELNQRLQTLQQEANTLTVASGNSTAVQAFSKGLKKAAEENAVALEDVQQIAFNNAAPQTVAQNNDVDQRVYARQMQSQQGQQANVVNASGSVGPRFAGQPMNAPNSTLSNAQLKNQVIVLEKALSSARNVSAKPQAEAKPDISKHEQEVAFGQIDLARTRLDTLKKQIDDGQAGKHFPLEAIQKQLVETSQWCDAYGNAYGTDDRIRKALTDLKSETRRLGTAAEQAQKQLDKTDTVALDIDGIINTDSPNDRRSFEKFIGANYLPLTNAEQGQVRVEGNNLFIPNGADNVKVLAAVAHKFRENSGLVVDVAGRNRPISPEQRSFLHEAGALSAQTPDGKRYGILDEAQYQTILQLLNTTPGAPALLPDAVPEAGTTELVVGTEGTAAHQQLKIAKSGTDYNGIAINGTPVHLPHNTYLLLDNGTYISVLKAGSARNWQTPGKPLFDLQPEHPFCIDFPNIGIPVLFEKTLLAAGESPAIIVLLNSTQRKR